MVTNFFVWTGALNTEWGGVSPDGTLSNWKLNGKVATITPGSADDSALFDTGGDIDVTGNGAAEKITVSNGTTVTFSGLMGAGFDGSPDAGLTVYEGSTVVV